MKIRAKHLHSEPKQRQQMTEMKERLRLAESILMEKVVILVSLFRS